MNTRTAQSRKTAASVPPPTHGPLLQRKCACGGGAGTSGECEACARKNGTLQRKSVNANAAGEAPPIVHEALHSPGQPLDPATRALMEPRFGHDFSRVRVHTDAKAAESARAVNALAYTVGRDVVFDAGQYAPRTPAGQGLLAHELTHVVQQRSAPYARPGPIEVAPASDVLETDARASEARRTPPIGSVGAVRLQRQVAATAGPEEDAELDRDFARIIAILNESHYSDRDEAEVIAILRRWAWRSESAVTSGHGRNPLDELFARLTTKTTTIGVVVGELASYYSLIFNHFDRVGDVREIRDRYSQRFQGDEGIAEVSLGEQLKEGGWKRTAEEFWSEKFKGMGEYLNQIGTPTLVQNLLGGVVGILQGFAEIVVELAEGALSLVQALDHVQGAVLHVLTGAAQELGLGFLKRLPLVGHVFDPETYRARYEATAGFLSGARAALQDPGQIWAGIKDAASKAWDEVMTEYQAADEFNKSRIIARGVVKVGMAIGGAIKDLPRLASSAAKFATTVGRVAVKAVRTLVEGLRSGFRLLGKVVRGTWKVVEDTLENGAKRLRYYFKRQGAAAADEVAEAQAAPYIRCSKCEITPKGKALDAAPDDEVEQAFAKLERGEVPQQGALLQDLLHHRQQPEALEQLERIRGTAMPGRPGRTPAGASTNPKPGHQSAHITPQSTLRNLPHYDPGEMITRILPTGRGHVHTMFDQSWQREFREIRRLTGRTTTTAREVSEVTARAARNSGAFSSAEAESMVDLIHEDLFVRLGLSPDQVLRMPGT